MEFFEGLNYKHMFSELLSIWDACDKYLSTQEPWKKDKDSDEAKRVIGNAAILCKMMAILSYPSNTKCIKRGV